MAKRAVRPSTKKVTRSMLDQEHLLRLLYRITNQKMNIWRTGEPGGSNFNTCTTCVPVCDMHVCMYVLWCTQRLCNATKFIQYPRFEYGAFVRNANSFAFLLNLAFSSNPFLLPLQATLPLYDFKVRWTLSKKWYPSMQDNPIGTGPAPTLYIERNAGVLNISKKWKRFLCKWLQ